MQARSTRRRAMARSRPSFLWKSPVGRALIIWSARSAPAGPHGSRFRPATGTFACAKGLRRWTLDVRRWGGDETTRASPLRAHVSPGSLGLDNVAELVAGNHYERGIQ